MRAVRGLRGTGTETAVASLARASTDDADPQVRLAALSALMSFPGHTMAQGLGKGVGKGLIERNRQAYITELVISIRHSRPFAFIRGQ